MESCIAVENGKILVMQVNWYTSGNAMLRHWARGVNVMLLMLYHFCRSQLGSWGRIGTSVPCFSLGFSLLGNFGSSSTVQHIGNEPAWVWCFPEGHVPRDLSVRCSNIHLALCRADLILWLIWMLPKSFCAVSPCQKLCYVIRMALHEISSGASGS